MGGLARVGVEYFINERSKKSLSLFINITSLEYYRNLTHFGNLFLMKKSVLSFQGHKKQVSKWLRNIIVKLCCRLSLFWISADLRQLNNLPVAWKLCIKIAFDSFQALKICREKLKIFLDNENCELVVRVTRGFSSNLKEFEFLSESFFFYYLKFILFTFV